MLTISEVKEMLSKVSPGTAKKEIIEDSSSFVFDIEEGVVYTFNDQIGVSTPFSEEMFLNVEDGKIVVPANEFVKVINKMPEGGVFIDVTKKNPNEVQIKSEKNIKSGITIRKESHLPIDEINNLDEIKWGKVSDDFIEGLLFCIPSIGKNPSHPQVECIHIREDGLIESTDGRRYSGFQTKTEFFSSVVVPGASLKSILKVKPVISEYAIAEGWLHLSDGQTYYSIRTMNIDFIDCSSITKKEGDVEFEFPEQVMEALDRSEIFDYSEEMYVNVCLGKDCITLKSRDVKGWLEEVIPVEYDNVSVSFWVTPSHLKHVLQTVKKCKFLFLLLKEIISYMSFPQKAINLIFK
jgi:DNA polymerase III sliding clamp (beta) subunit (PCNA family)